MILEGQLSSARDGTSSITPDVSHSTRQSDPNIKWDKIIPLILRLALVHGLEDGRESKSGDRRGKNVSEPQGHGAGLPARGSPPTLGAAATPGPARPVPVPRGHNPRVASPQSPQTNPDSCCVARSHHPRPQYHNLNPVLSACSQHNNWRDAIKWRRSRRRRP